MLGHNGGKWLDRLLQQLAKELRAIGWTQMQIASATGSTQSTASHQIMKPVLELGASADETTMSAAETTGEMVALVATFYVLNIRHRQSLSAETYPQ